MFEYFSSILPDNILIILFFLMLLNGIISAPPSELTLISAGLWSANFGISFFTILLVAILGNITGAIILYFIGYKYGDKLLKRIQTNKKGFINNKLNKFIPNPQKMDIYARVFTKSSWLLIGLFRCLPVVRSIVSLPAGYFRIPLIRFIYISFLGIIVWALIWIGIGALFYDIYISNSLLISVITLSILALAILYAYKYLKRVTKNIIYGIESNA